tara:strand:- start:8012 stop:8284 length:273 start_codon:yes stop_codon:yes gene_type:complete
MIDNNKEKLREWRRVSVNVSPKERCGAKVVFFKSWDYQQKKIDDLEKKFAEAVTAIKAAHRNGCVKESVGIPCRFCNFEESLEERAQGDS